MCVEDWHKEKQLLNKVVIFVLFAQKTDIVAS